MMQHLLEEEQVKQEEDCRGREDENLDNESFVHEQNYLYHLNLVGGSMEQDNVIKFLGCLTI